MTTVLTGASGFLGQYIYHEISKISKVITVSRKVADINLDLATDIPQLPFADLVIHCAGKAHSVPKTDIEKKAFFDSNLTGTLNLLKGLEQGSRLPRSFVFISTVAVYGCDKGILINEEQPLNAKDAYGQSKIQAEHLVQEWCIEHDIICSILRLPLLIGANPPGNLGAMIKAIKKGYYFNIAGGKAKKSMVLAADVAYLIPTVALVGGIYNLTDGEHPSFFTLSNKIAKGLGKANVTNIPYSLVKVIAIVGDLLGSKFPINSIKLNKITTDLTFDDSKARKIINWRSTSIIENFKIDK